MISVIIPTFNRADKIKRALLSVLNQTFRDFECIVVDDGSTDNTQEILRQFKNEIITVKSENRGVSAARNLGVKISNGDYIAFLDSDDEWKRDKLGRQFNHLVRENYKINQTEEIWIRNGRFLNKKKRHAKPSGDIFFQSLEMCSVSPSAVMMEKSLYDEYGGFDETKPVCEDYDLWLRISLKEKVGLLNEPLVIKYGGHSDQLSATPAMDKYRIISLFDLSQNSILSDDKMAALLAILSKKIAIYANGAKKRGNFKNAEWAENLLNKIKI